MITQLQRRRSAYRARVYRSDDSRRSLQILKDVLRAKRTSTGIPVPPLGTTTVLRPVRGYGGVAHRNLEASTDPLHLPRGGEGDVPQSVVDGWFEGLEEDAVQAGNLVPQADVVNETKRIVNALRQRLPLDTDVYTLEDGRIEVEVHGPTGYGVSLICEPGGSALCLVTARDASRRARYSNSSVLPDGFLREGLMAVRGSCEATTHIEAEL